LAELSTSVYCKGCCPIVASQPFLKPHQNNNAKALILFGYLAT
jgi:hypothetical protein